MAHAPLTRTRATEETVNRWLVEYARRRERAGTGRNRGDVPFEELRSRIARHFAPLVESVARRYTATGEPLEDLVQEGYLGLLSALDNWDPDRGVKFSTYSVHFISGTIRHFLRDRCRPIREPAWVHSLAYRIDQVSGTLVHELERTPQPEEIATALGVPTEQVEEAIAARSRAQTVSLVDAEVEPGTGEGVDLGRLLGDAPPLQRLIEDKLFLERALSELKTREQQVVYEFYFRDLNQVEIARKIGVSANYVSVTLRKATERLRRLFLEAEVRDRSRGRESSILDPATGLYSVEHIRARLVEGVSNAARHGLLYSLVTFELKGLPSSGRGREEALRECGQKLHHAIRRADLAGRWSEESLVALLPGTGEQAYVVADRVAPQLVAAARNVGVALTPVCRWAWYPDQGRTGRELSERLDAAGEPGPVGALPLAA